MIRLPLRTFGEIHPEQFQIDIINSMSSELLENRTPLLLRAPTGAGKTLMLGRIVQSVYQQTRSVWFWFVPYNHLVAQTASSLSAACRDLVPYPLAKERQAVHTPGDVLISAIQTVSIADKNNRKIFIDDDYSLPSLQRLVTAIRSRHQKIGIVVDEAHIGLTDATEFGRFCASLNPDFFLLATATPRDDKLASFFAAANYSSHLTYSISRADVVEAALNKAFIEAHVFRLEREYSEVIDQRRTALKAAWQKHELLKQKMSTLSLPTKPLMLVQIENGASTAVIREILIADCGCSADAITEHTSSKPDPIALASISEDLSQEALIFKESAGTGFDAPRANILVSLKNVISENFATQFLGRVMRVERSVRRLFLSGHRDPDLDTAYIYLLNPEAQAGFQDAVKTQQRIETELRGVVSEIYCRQGSNGEVIFTNRDSFQGILVGSMLSPLLSNSGSPDETRSQIDLSQQSLFGNFLDAQETRRAPSVADAQTSYGSRAVFEGRLSRSAISFYRLRDEIQNRPSYFSSERRPPIRDLREVGSVIAESIDISEHELRAHLTAILRGVEASELITELTKEMHSEIAVRGFVNPDAIARAATHKLTDLPQLEEADRNNLRRAICDRIANVINAMLSLLREEDRPVDASLQSIVRGVANLIILKHITEIERALHHALATRVEVFNAEQLPSMMLWGSSLATSRKNLYGVFPPNKASYDDILSQLNPYDRLWLSQSAYLTLKYEDGNYDCVAFMDHSSALNRDERYFAELLDDASFVSWWHRNPDKKPYSVGIVRTDSAYRFYPDFVVCITPVDGASTQMRLIETKESLKDAIRKGRRDSVPFGQVVFITREADDFFIVGRDGTLGSKVGRDLRGLREEIRRTFTK